MRFPPFQSRKDAARFLRRTTFGPSAKEIEHAYEIGAEAWMAEQRAKPLINSFDAYVERGGPVGPRRIGPPARQHHFLFEAFWFHAVHSPDQLRKRVMFALSQILVVSAEDKAIGLNPQSLAVYMDLLNRHALGNYRDLLVDVAKSPAMGTYLSHRGNERVRKRNKRQPDENFARELMQLFTIGLWELESDGSIKVDARGAPIAAYDLDDVRGLAKVFTGWSWGGGKPTDARWNGRKTFKGETTKRWDVPMIAYERYHERREKRIVGGHVIAKRTSAEDSLNQAIDVLFNHANTPPFLSRLLIQRLVTSNPSPAYVKRVADVFRDNGDGVRGDLFATVSAILSDEEAWIDAGQTKQAGKLREPAIRICHWMRAFADKDAFYTHNLSRDMIQIGNSIGQLPCAPPSVFNWYEPDYAPLGPMTQQGLVAPEFKVNSDHYFLNLANTLRSMVQKGVKLRTRGAQFAYPELHELSQQPDLLVDHLSLVLCAGQLREDARALIVRSVRRIPENNKARRVHTGLYMVMMSPDFQVEI